MRVFLEVHQLQQFLPTGFQLAGCPYNPARPRRLVCVRLLALLFIGAVPCQHCGYEDAQDIGIANAGLQVHRKLQKPVARTSAHIENPIAEILPNLKHEPRHHTDSLPCMLK